MIYLIGGPPSCGSTLLADLLDSSPKHFCTGETGLFCNPKIYDFKKYKEEYEPYTPHPRPTNRTLKIKNDANCHLAIGNFEWRKIIKETDDFESLISQLHDGLISLRGKEKDSLWIDKYPDNIYAIDQFFSTFPNGKFIFITRNPFWAINSFYKRGLDLYSSILSWFFAHAKLEKALENPMNEILIIRYEDLVQNPFVIASNILVNTSPEEIQNRFINNHYRQMIRLKPKTWMFKSGTKIGNANAGFIDHYVVYAIKAAAKNKVSDKFAELFGLSQTSFEILAEKQNYHIDPYGNPLHMPLSKKKDAFMKWHQDCKNGNVKMKDLWTYMKPLDKK